MNSSITVPWMAELGLITVRSFTQYKRVPLPSEIVSTFIIFGAFSLVPDQRLQSLLGWGIVIATALDVLPHTSYTPPGQLNVKRVTSGVPAGPPITVTGQAPQPGINVNPTTGQGY